MHHALIMADQITQMLDNAGLTETERYVALNVAKALIAVTSRQGVTFVESELSPSPPDEDSSE